MDFVEFDERIKRVSDLISEDKFQPDAIVGIARGGWIPSRLFSKHLGVKKLLSCGVVYKDKARTEMEMYQDVSELDGSMKLLVVEDYLESGKSLRHVMSLLESRGAELRSAAVGYLSHSLIVPTYSLGCLSEIPKLPWD